MVSFECFCINKKNPLIGLCENTVKKIKCKYGNQSNLNRLKKFAFIMHLVFFVIQLNYDPFALMSSFNVVFFMARTLFPSPGISLLNFTIRQELFRKL